MCSLQGYVGPHQGWAAEQETARGGGDREEMGRGALGGGQSARFLPHPGRRWRAEGAAAEPAVWGKHFGIVLSSLHPAGDWTQLNPVTWQPVLPSGVLEEAGPSCEGQVKGVACPGLWGFFLGCGAWKWGKKMLSDSLGLAWHPELVPAVTRGGDTGQLGTRVS